MTQTLNPSDKAANATLSNANLTITASSGTYNFARATNSYSSSGKYYFEFTITDVTNGAFVGVAGGSVSLTAHWGTGGVTPGWCLNHGGNGWGAGSNSITGAGAWSNGDIICMAWDVAAGKLWLRKNNASWIGGGDPASGTSPSFSGLSGTLFPGCGVGATPSSITVNFGATAYTYTAPSGFTGDNPPNVATFAVTEAQDTASVAMTAIRIDASFALTEAQDTMLVTGEMESDTSVTWNPSDKGSGIVLSNGNLTAARTPSGTYQSVRATHARSTGKYYFEVTAVSAAGSGIGLMTSSASLDAHIGNDAFGWGYLAGGNFWNNGSFSSDPSKAFSNGDIIGVAVDISNGKLWFSKNGTYVSGDPVAGTSPSFSNVTGSVYPAWCSNIEATGTANFGQTGLSYGPPSGFEKWQDLGDVSGSIGATETADAFAMVASYPAHGPLDVTESQDIGAFAGVAANATETVICAVGTAGKIVTSTDGATWTSQLSFTTRQLNGVTQAGSGGTWVVVGQLGTILSSPDTVTWTTRSSGITDNLNAVAYGNGLFVAVSSLGKIITSPDGITWTQRTSGTTLSLLSVNYADSLWVVAGASGRLITSSDGITWTTQTAFSPASIIEDVTFSDNEGLWVAIGSTPSRRIWSSTDGISWTVRHTPSMYMYSVVYGATDDLFVAVGNTLDTVDSPDGITWTDRSSIVGTGNLNSVTYDGAQFIAVGTGSLIYTSPDGTTWTQQTSPVSSNYYDVFVGDYTVPTPSAVFGQLNVTDAPDTFSGTGFSTVTNNVISELVLVEPQDEFTGVTVSTSVSGDMPLIEDPDVVSFGQDVDTVALKILPSTFDEIVTFGATIFDGGTLYIYTGSQPLEPDDTPTGNLLAVITLPDPAFSEAEDGEATKVGDWEGVATDNGVAGWFRLISANEENSIDGSVTTTLGGGNMIATNTNFKIGDPVVVTSCTFGFNLLNEE